MWKGLMSAFVIVKFRIERMRKDAHEKEKKMRERKWGEEREGGRERERGRQK